MKQVFPAACLQMSAYILHKTGSLGVDMIFSHSVCVALLCVEAQFSRPSEKP